MYLPARDYPSWRQSRLTDRLDESARLVGLRNNLISVIVYVIDAGKASPRLDATLRSLLQQTYRNIEVLVVGGAIGNAQQSRTLPVTGACFSNQDSHILIFCAICTLTGCGAVII